MSYDAVPSPRSPSPNPPEDDQIVPDLALAEESGDRRSLPEPGCARTRPRCPEARATCRVHDGSVEPSDEQLAHQRVRYDMSLLTRILILHGYEIPAISRMYQDEIPTISRTYQDEIPSTSRTPSPASRPRRHPMANVTNMTSWCPSPSQARQCPSQARQCPNNFPCRDLDLLGPFFARYPDGNPNVGGRRRREPERGVLRTPRRRVPFREDLYDLLGPLLARYPGGIADVGGRRLNERERDILRMTRRLLFYLPASPERSNRMSEMMLRDFLVSGGDDNEINSNLERLRSLGYS